MALLDGKVAIVTGAGGGIGMAIAATLAEARETLATSLSPMDIGRRAFDPYDLLNIPQTTSGSASPPYAPPSARYTPACAARAS